MGRQSRGAPERASAHPRDRGLQPVALGALDEALTLVAAIRRTLPRYSVEDLLRAFHLDENGVALIHEGARRIGFA